LRENTRTVRAGGRGPLAAGIDGNQEPPDEDVFFDMNVKQHLR